VPLSAHSCEVLPPIHFVIQPSFVVKTVMTMAALSMFIEVVSSMRGEICMFIFAAIVHLIFTRSFVALGPRPPPSRPQVKESSVRPPVPVREKCSRKDLTPNHKEEMLAVYMPIFQASKSWDAEYALNLLAKLPSSDQKALPLLVAMRVLLALSKTPISDTVMYQFMDLCELFDVKAFESAAGEASRWRCIPACRQLYRLAGLAAVQKTERFVVLLVRGHSNDVLAMKQLVEDVLGEDSGIAQSRTLMDSLAAQCSAAGDPATVELILSRGKQRADTVPLSMSRQAKIISAYGKDGNLAGALDAFSRLQQSSSELNSMTYNCLLDACVECKDLKQALDVFAEMKSKDGIADIVSYNTIMKGYLANGDIKAARDLVPQMLENGLCPNRVSFHSLLTSMIQQNRWREAWEWVDETAKHGVTASSTTCAMLLKGINSSSCAELAKINELTDSCDIPMDEVLFGSFAEACIRCQLLTPLWNRLQQLTKGDRVQISPPTYGNMMKAYGQAQDVPKVKSLWVHMCIQNVKMTPITLGCLMEALVANHCAEHAWDIVGKIWEDPEQRNLINTVVYSTIVKGFTMLKQHGNVLAVYKEMKARRIRCNTITYNTMLNALARCGMMCEVPMLLKDMQMSEPPVHPDIVTYSTLVKGYCMAGELDKSLELFEDMKRSGDVKPDEVLFNGLLDGCCKQQKLEKALSLLQEMRESGVNPSNYTLSIICKLLGRARCLEQAFTMLKEITDEYRFKPNIQVYTCLMQACFHNQQCQRALDLHDQVVSSGTCTPDEKTYNVMVRGCLQLGAVDKALEVVRCAFHLPGHKMKQTWGSPKGVEPSILEQLPGARGDQLRKELRGVGLTSSSAVTHRDRRHAGSH